ncbi:DUF397 domain-containing protein [Nocardiopsis sp. CT-R113]|uniref:DUF397 domain-containing protein n=1 Tax=Nocardiopsis codii TaxID=3065942 RepID=A0ABU7K7E8_9ACTN|nr:DUF397 domain-containing protein [Nocardiopsis sp. CT-R113]MEE2037467.1 DUF397 domain-containing protein [Nocardiopsis sp. CT-R113]
MMSRSWKKSSYSNGSGGQCVEARIMPGQKAAVRDTQNRELGHLAVPAPEWTALVNAVRGR